jgi:hypothetical protein
MAALVVVEAVPAAVAVAALLGHMATAQMERAPLQTMEQAVAEPMEDQRRRTAPAAITQAATIAVALVAALARPETAPTVVVEVVEILAAKTAAPAAMARCSGRRPRTAPKQGPVAVVVEVAAIPTETAALAEVRAAVVVAAAVMPSTTTARAATALRASSSSPTHRR